MKKRLSIIIMIIIILLGNVTLGADNGEEDLTQYDITLTQSYNYGDQKVNLEWTGVSDDQKLADVAQVRDYVDYPITQNLINSNYEALTSKIKRKTEMKENSSTKWKVIYNDGETVKLVSTDIIGRTSVGREDYDWRESNPYSYGDRWGDCGGYGLFYQIDQIAKCYADYTLATNVRAVDIADLPHSSALLNLKRFLGQTESDEISIEIREEGFEEIYDTDRHGDIFGIGGYRNYDAKVATITDTNGLYTGGSKFFLPNYYNGTDFIRAVYYVDGNTVSLRRVYPKGATLTAGVKAVVTLKTGIYKTSGDGSPENPWKISVTPGHGIYTVYQKSENEEEYTEKITTSIQHTVLDAQDGVLDLIGPDKPNAELGLIRGDGWNLKLTVNSGDRGTDYYHKIVAKAGLNNKEYISNEIQTTITTGVAGYVYVIDDKEDTDPGNEIMFKQGEDITVPRVKINVGNYIHIKAIDYAGNESEVLHMPLKFVFSDLNLFKTYKELSDVNEYGIAETPGWNYINIDWNPIEIAKDDPEEMPDVILTIDVSGSMRGSRISTVRAGAQTLVKRLHEYYPEMKIGIVAFSSGPSVRATPTNNLDTLLSAINGLGASGGTDAAGGINTATNLFVDSTQRNHVLIVMTDGYPNSSSATSNALSRAKSNGLKIVSLIIETNASGIFAPYSDSLYKVSSNDESLYDTIAYSLYQEIVDTMIAKYYPYRVQEGDIDFSLLTKDPITDIEYPDGQATDKAGPSRPLVTLSETADKDGNIKMNIWAEDRGTSYEFYVKFVHPRTKDELYSNTVVQEIKTGIKGYAWTISDDKNTDPGGTIKDLQLTFGKEYVGKWLHIRAVDYAGNLGEICHIKIETSRFIPWEELDSTEELFCVQYGQTIPAREDEEHLNAVVKAGSGAYEIREVVADPKTGDRIGTKFVEGTTNNIYGTQDIYSYSLGKYQISPDTPKVRPRKRRKCNRTGSVYFKSL